MRGLDDGRARRSGHTPPLHTHSGDHTRLKLLSMGRAKAVRLLKGKSAVLAPWSWPGFRGVVSCRQGDAGRALDNAEAACKTVRVPQKITEEPMSIDRRHVLQFAV